MKSIYTALIALFACTFYGQEASNFSKMADSVAYKPLTPDFSYYSKNYREIFGNDVYTYDRLAVRAHKIYVGTENDFYNDGTQLWPYRVPAMNTLVLPGEPLTAGEGLATMAIAGLITLMQNGFTFEKDYQPNVDPELLKPQE